MVRVSRGVRCRHVTMSLRGFRHGQIGRLLKALRQDEDHVSAIREDVRRAVVEDVLHRELLLRERGR